MHPFVSTLSIMQALKTVLSALKLPGQDTEPLFELVQFYDSTDIGQAFADLVVSRQKRVCLIIPSRQSFVKGADGDQVTKVAQFMIIFADTDRKTGQDALFGGPKNTGVIAMADEVAKQITGHRLGLPWVCIEPIEGDDLLVYDETKQTDTGRKGWLFVIQTDAGATLFPIHP